ncbi:hypothetical protein ACFQWA_13980 [Streptomyces thermogriseus]
MAVGPIGVTTSGTSARRRRALVPPTPAIAEEDHTTARDGCGDGYGV